ncbi:hypothetical protein D3C87_2049600 [compost metagenome]
MLARQAVGQFTQRVFAPAQETQRGARCGVLLRQGATQATAGAGDEDSVHGIVVSE